MSRKQKTITLNIKKNRELVREATQIKISVKKAIDLTNNLDKNGPLMQNP